MKAVHRGVGPLRVAGPRFPQGPWGRRDAGCWRLAACTPPRATLRSRPPPRGRVYARRCTPDGGGVHRSPDRMRNLTPSPGVR